MMLHCFMLQRKVSARLQLKRQRAEEAAAQKDTDKDEGEKATGKRKSSTTQQKSTTIGKEDSSKSKGKGTTGYETFKSKTKATFEDDASSTSKVTASARKSSDDEPKGEDVEIKEEPMSPEEPASPVFDAKSSSVQTKLAQLAAEADKDVSESEEKTPDAQEELEGKESKDNIDFVEVKEEPVSSREPTPPPTKRRKSERVIGVVETIPSHEVPSGLAMLQQATFVPPGQTPPRVETKSTFEPQSQSTVRQLPAQMEPEETFQSLTQSSAVPLTSLIKSTSTSQSSVQPVKIRVAPKRQGSSTVKDGKYTCDICDAYFINAYQCIRHMKQVHSTATIARDTEGTDKNPPIPPRQPPANIEVILLAAAEAEQAKSGGVAKGAMGGAKRTVGVVKGGVSGVKGIGDRPKGAAGGAKGSEGGAKGSGGGTKMPGGAKVGVPKESVGVVKKEGGAKGSVGGVQVSSGGARSSIESRQSSLTEGKGSVGEAEGPVTIARRSLGHIKLQSPVNKTAPKPSTSSGKGNVIIVMKKKKKQKEQQVEQEKDDDDESRLNCQFCNRAFLSANIRKKHEETHFGPQRFKNIL